MTDRNERERGAMEEIGRTMGGMAGRAAEAATDIGMSMMKGAADVLGGWWASGAREAARTWSETQDRMSRQHFESSLDMSGEADTSAGGASAEVHAEGGTDADTDSTTGATGGSASGYEEARPYYQLGHTARQNPEYQARNFEDVEPELRKVAEQGDAGGATDEWSDVRGYVQFGFEGQGEEGRT